MLLRKRAVLLLSSPSDLSGERLAKPAARVVLQINTPTGRTGLPGPWLEPTAIRRAWGSCH